jgi:hypothetical protein
MRGRKREGREEGTEEDLLFPYLPRMEGGEGRRKEEERMREEGGRRKEEGGGKRGEEGGDQSGDFTYPFSQPCKACQQESQNSRHHTFLCNTCHSLPVP